MRKSRVKGKTGDQCSDLDFKMEYLNKGRDAIMFHYEVDLNIMTQLCAIGT